MTKKKKKRKEVFSVARTTTVSRVAGPRKDMAKFN